MVILHTETLKKWGGQQNRVLTETVGLNKRGHRVMIACHRGSMLAERARRAGVKVYEVNMVKQAHLSTIPRLVRIIRREGVEIVSTHSSVDSWAGGIAAKLTGRHLVRFRHNLYPIGGDPLTRFIYAIPDRFIVTSNTVKAILLRRGVKEEEITVMPSAVDPGIFTPEAEDLRKELRIPPGTVVIGNTSGFTGVKGQKYLLQAFDAIHREVPSVLLLAGRVNERVKNRCLSYVREDLRDKVIFPGLREDVPNVLKTIDVFVFPSLAEGIGTALLEAMAMERPVAVSDIPTFREFITEGVNGVFFRVKDPGGIARQVLSLLKDRTLMNSLGANARTTVLERFTVDRMIDHTESVYKEILNAP